MSVFGLACPLMSGTIVLEACTKAIAAGDGRELWQNAPNGQITNAVSKKCIAGDVEKGITLTSCDEGTTNTWEAQGNGMLSTRQVLFFPQSGLCVTCKVNYDWVGPSIA